MARVSRRSWLLGLAPWVVAAKNRYGLRQKFDSMAVQLLDPLTERRMWQLTDPKILHHLPHYHHRFISAKGSFLLMASEAPGSRQIFRMNLPDGDMVQLTEGPGIHSYSPTLAPRDRAFYLLQADALKMVSVKNGRDRQIYRSPQGWRMTGHLSLSGDGRRVAIVEMREEHWTDDFEQQFRRNPRCRIQVVDTQRGHNHTIVDERQWLAHPQFRPGGNDILYCHEGPWGQVENRLHLVTSGGKQKALRPREGSEQLGHEYWTRNGREICYVFYPDETGRGGTVRCLNPESSQERVLSRCTSFGWLTGNHDDSAIIGASRSLASPNIYVLFPHLKREITICEHASTRQPHPIAGTDRMDRCASFPEPVFSPDSRWVYFTSDKQGLPAVYRVDVGDLVEVS